MTFQALVIDDDLDFGAELAQFLEEMNFNVETANTFLEATNSIMNNIYDFVFLDLKLPDGFGLDLLIKIKSRSSATTVLIISSYSEVKLAVKALKFGAADYLQKPLDPEYLSFVLKELMTPTTLATSEDVTCTRQDKRGAMVTARSELMRAVEKTCLRAAMSDASILLTGETGTGKQVLAHFIHQHSPRHELPFVYVNCACLSETLLETDLFGHEKGAFTGAHKIKKGRAEIADGGTLFLDEIGELPLTLQAKLLHFVEYGAFNRVGGLETLTSDVRIMCATNRILEEAVRREEFRKDLYFRINVIRIEVPPLRQRREDIPALIDYYTSFIAQKAGKPIPAIPQHVMDWMISYSWPGNIRELMNALERAIVLSEAPILSKDDFLFSVIDDSSLPCQVNTDLFSPKPLQEAVNYFKKLFVENMLLLSEGNQTKAASILGIQRTYLNKLIKELSLDKDPGNQP